MLTTNTKLRAAAVAGVTAIITAGAIGPAAACDHTGGHRGAAASGRHARARGTERGDSRPTSHAGDDRRTTGRSGNDAGGQHGDRSGTSSRSTGHERSGDHRTKAGHETRGPREDQGGEAPSKDHEHGHQRVTVCHLLGNGSYHLLTFDEHALKAHLHHGDLYPVPADGCPTPGTPAETTPGGNDTDTTPAAPGGTTTVPGATLPGGTTAGTTPGSAEVLGVQEIRPGGAPTVLGTQAVRSTGTAPTVNTAARVAPTAGLLPNTGAGAMTLPLLGGLGLVGAGAALVARRRTRADS